MSNLERNLRQIEEYKKQAVEEKQLLTERMKKIKHKVAVISGKGGVGKSTVTVNLAAAFAMTGDIKVGLLDADIHGPSVPRLLGLVGQQVKVGPPGAFPVMGPLGIKVASMDFFLEAETPTIWRGPLKMRAIRQLLQDIVWGELDVLFIDLPPGTGDEPLSIAQLLPEIDGVIIVTMPSELSKAVVEKAITFARTMNMPIIGIVENMSGFICPHCGTKIDIFQSGGGEELAKQTQVPFLGNIPIDPEIGKDSDRGIPFIEHDPSSPAAKAFTEIVKKLEGYLQQREKTKA